MSQLVISNQSIADLFICYLSDGLSIMQFEENLHV